MMFTELHETAAGAMTYNESTFDHGRLVRYAHAVAVDIAGVLPASTTRRYWLDSHGKFFKRTRWIDETKELDGWILLVDPEEGAARGLASGEYFLDAWENGRLLLLGLDGVLRTAEYSLVLKNSRRSDGRPLGTISLVGKIRECSRGDALSFDRLNRYDTSSAGQVYSDRQPGPGELWRRELATNWAIRVPNAGMEASLALKRLREKRQYVRQLNLTP